MKIIVTETQYNLLKELSSNSSGVEEFLEMVKNNDGLLKHLGFRSMKSLKEYITDGHFKDFDDLRKEAKDFMKKQDKK